MISIARFTAPEIFSVDRGSQAAYALPGSADSLKTAKYQRESQAEKNPCAYSPPKNSENLSALSVADVTIIFRSLLLEATFFRIPNRTSVCNDLKSKKCKK